uniref:Trypsinogen-like protein 3 n=1 Tax=Oncorhynchus kisutch TaxID=8019 RepID=A0A8C7M773_ONCKI
MQPILYSTLLYSTLLYSTLLYSTLLYSTLLYSTLLYSTLLHSTLLYSTPLLLRPGHTMVSLGEHDLTVEEGTEQHVRVARYVQHGPYARGPSHSLAMVKLAEPARFTQHVMPVALPTRCTQLHEKCLVSGWGSTVPGQDEPNLILKCETQRVIDDKMCQIAFPLYWIEHAFCAKTIISTDNCLSDQGSTVVCGGELQGLFWSSSSDVGLYTRLCLYLNWISDIMNTPDPTPEPAWTTAAAATTW